MSQIPCRDVVAFVEGAMERLFINRSFPGIRAVPVGNSVTVLPSALARDIDRKFRALNRNFQSVIVWIDREQRRESCEDICKAIEKELSAINSPCKSVIFLINDRNVENLFLLDRRVIECYIKDLDVPDCTGKNGKAVLKGLFAARGIYYKELVHGVEMLRRLRVGRLIDSCFGCRELVSAFPACWWTEAD